MTSPFSDELISAYLDGELTAREQAYVEEQFRENADLRRMCDELRALRAALQAMPVAEPPENFAERILRQAERRMLSDDAALTDATLAAAAREPSPEGGSRRALRDWQVGMAVVVALAACVLAMLFVPPLTQRARNVARGPDAAMSVPAPAENRSDYLARTDVDTTGTAAATDSYTGQEGPVTPHAGTNMARRAASVRSVAPAAADPARAAPQEVEATALPRTEKLQEDRPNGEMFGGAAAEQAQPAPANADAAPQEGPAEVVSPSGFGGGGMLGGGQAGFPGSGAAGGMGGAANSESTGLANPGTGSPGSTGAGMGLPAGGMAMPGAGAVAGRDLGEGEVEERLTAGAPMTAQQLDQLVVELGKTQMLLVKVQLPQHELSASLAALGTSSPVDQPTDEGAVRALQRYSLSLEPAKVEENAAEQVVLQHGEPGGQTNLDVFLVDGSADQVRQSLANLVAKPGVAIETAPTAFKAFVYRSYGAFPGLKEDMADAERQSGDDIPETAADETKAKTESPHLGSWLERSKQLTEHAGVRRAEPAMDRKRSDPDDKPASGRGTTGAKKMLADKGADSAVDSPTREGKDVAENRTIIYILFRLRSN